MYTHKTWKCAYTSENLKTTPIRCFHINRQRWNTKHMHFVHKENNDLKNATPCLVSWTAHASHLFFIQSVVQTQFGKHLNHFSKHWWGLTWPPPCWSKMKQRGWKTNSTLMNHQPHVEDGGRSAQDRFVFISYGHTYGFQSTFKVTLLCSPSVMTCQ